MTIEIVVGLPHLNNGPILARARLMQQPMLISANCLSRWRDRGGWRNWEGWRQGQLGNATGLRSLDLDSAGYVLTSRYGGRPLRGRSQGRLTAGKMFPKTGRIFPYSHAQAPSPEGLTIRARVPWVAEKRGG